MNLWTKTMLCTGAIFCFGIETGTPEHTEHMRVIIQACMATTVQAAALSFVVADAFEAQELAFDQPFSTKFATIQALIQLVEGQLH